MTTTTTAAPCEYPGCERLTLHALCERHRAGADSFATKEQASAASDKLGNDFRVLNEQAAE